MEVFEKQIVENIKRRIISEHEKTSFLETKVGRFLSIDLTEAFVNIMALKMYESGVRKTVEGSENIDKKILTKLSLFPTEETIEEIETFIEWQEYEDMERYYKRMFSEYLDINEDEIVLIAWDRIDQLILNKYKHSIRGKVRYFVLPNKKSS